MKNDKILNRISILFSFTAIIFLSSGCEKTWSDEYIIVNDTGYNVSIFAYDTKKDPFTENETFVINSSFEYKILKGRGFQADYPGIFKYPETDSVIIKFNNEKIIIQSCEFSQHISCDFDRSLMNYLNEEDFVKTEFEGRGTRYTYTIAEADYERAVPFEAK